MSSNQPQDLFEIRTEQEITIVRFTRRTILEPLMIEKISDRLLSLVHEEAARHLVLNFAGVESLTSAMLSKFIVLNQAITTAKGQLVFCDIESFLERIFTICQIPKTIPVVPAEADAIAYLRRENPE
jgi:anti-anti-sigma factor